MTNIEQYRVTKNCYKGEIDGYGYAFVPGSSFGIVLLDLKTKKLLDNSRLLYRDKDQTRMKLLLQHKLLEHINVAEPYYSLEIDKIKSVEIWLHVTNDCNLDCPYCYIINKDSSRMSHATANACLEKLEQTVNRHQLETVSIRIAGGEPTLNEPVVKYVISECRKRFIDNGVKVKFIILTNGTLLNEDWIQLIADNNIKLCVSLDGIGRWHDKLRFFKNGKGSFDRVVKNLDLCIKNGIQPWILTTITDDNIDGIPVLSKFLIDSNLPFRYGVFRDNSGSYRDYQEFIDRVQNVLEYSYTYYAHAIREQNANFSHQLSDIHLDARRHLRSCNIGYSGVTVNHLGQIFLCQAYMKNPLGTIWDKPDFLELAWSQQTLPELNGVIVTNYEGCQDCSWALVCGGGCPI